MAIVVALAVAFAGTGAAQAATIAVSNGNDSGPGSLRAAVAAANPGDTITIPALTVSLSSGQIVVGKSLTIAGAGARQTTISGSGQSRVFAVTSGTVSISGVTVTGGDGFDVPGGTAGEGGGILVSGGALTLTDSTVTGNQTAGFNEGSGIAAESTLAVVRSTISYNSGPGSNRAGGIGFAGAGTFQLIDSTVAHNTLIPSGLGAGVYVNSAGALAFTNDTLDLNSAGATGSVLDLNGENAPTSIANTIVLGGTSDSCSRMPATSPTAGGNIEDQKLCEFTAASDHPSTNLALGALQNNGGPTDTQLPAAGGLAIDAGVDAACPATDQRGVPRPQGPHCDIGSVERTTPTVGTPTVSNITPTGASVTATANPVFIGGTYVYNYGTTTAYGKSTAPAQLQAGVAGQPAPATLTGLAPGTPYHLQLVVTTPDGTVSSTDVTFTTGLPSPPSPQPPPTTTPAISNLSISPHSFSLAGRKVGSRCVKPTTKNNRRKHCRRAISLQIRYSLNVAATVTFTLKLQTAGRKVSGRCVKATKKNSRRGKCTLFEPVRGQVVVGGKPGANSLPFNGIVGGRQLGPGTYLLIATPAGGRSSEVTTFQIVP
jgi:hypothetical protein